MFAYALVVVFGLSTLGVMAGWLLNRSATKSRAWARSLRFSTAAVVPAMLLFVESSLHLVHGWLVPGAEVPSYDYFAVVPSLLWIVIGPALFLKALIVRVPSMPVRLLCLQIAQAVSWASSSAVALWFVAMV